MQRFLRIFIGPELYWVVLYLGVRWLAAENVPPTGPGNTALEWIVWLTATVGVATKFRLAGRAGREPMDIIGTTRPRGVCRRECLRDRCLRSNQVSRTWTRLRLDGLVVHCGHARRDRLVHRCGISLLILRVKSRRP